MKVFFHEAFYGEYTFDPAAAAGRMESVVSALEGRVTFVRPEPATLEDILLAHTRDHVDAVTRDGLFEIAALAAGGALAAANEGLLAPSFAAIRPPGHHASSDSAWGFCFFNNMAVALLALKNRGKIKRAHVLDFDLHFGDGNVNILGERNWVTLHNPPAGHREAYLAEVEETLRRNPADIIGISAGFDNHEQDWGGLLKTRDYRAMGGMVARAARKNNGGCFAILEGGYNHRVLGENALALVEGMEKGFDSP